MVFHTLLKEAENIRDQVVAWRRYLHQHPELSFAEHETAKFIENTLRSFDHLLVTRPTPTSVMARLVGESPGKIIAVRADIDALPIQEENDLPYCSKTKGAMHACGHDGHTAMLLGVAKILSKYHSFIKGEVRFLFQHAEELPPGGAEEMVAAGVMNNVDLVIGAHLQSTVEVGKVGVVSGPMLASPDTFHLTIFGKGGHAAEPHLTVDTIAIGAQVITNLQHLVSRYVNPMEPLVVSVTKFIGGDTHNVIPGSVELCGTVRSINPEVRQHVPKYMEQIIQGITQAHGAEFELKYDFGYRPVVNDEKVTQIVEETVIELFGSERLYHIKPSMSADDFSAFQNRSPGTYFNIGAGNKSLEIVHPHHHPKFNIDEDSLEIGIKVFIGTLIKTLNLHLNNEKSAVKQ
ncbi:M20 family metallopeptidase [Metabacillus fastidiosus]|uniref:M20 family metallopeptidase n=1 Tax=Metabacillus fastidiosus TaxID=1458 RepID=UPI002E1DC5F2|nr:M20 family metallopeptidase [Metabacillus fastidiosus]